MKRSSGGTGSAQGWFGRGIAPLAILGGLMVPASAAEPSLWEREKLTGEWGGARTALRDRGIEVGITYIGETLAVLSGGLRRGTAFEGRLDVQIDTDLEKLIGWTGARTRGFQIHKGRYNAADLVGSIADPSNIDAVPTTRLFTAWYQQELGKNVSVRIGQLAADDEFLTSTTAGGLINGTFGWATIMASNLPSGGPAYPLATPGVRLQINPAENFSIIAAVFSGDPVRRSCRQDDPAANPQVCNRTGTTFSFDGGAFWIGEAQYQVNQAKEATGLAAAYKFGMWYHSGDFADQRLGLDAAGQIALLATSPESSLYQHSNWGLYGVIDQMLWRGPSGSLSVFARGGVAPSDRNLLSWYVDGGIGIKGLLPGRADDTLTFGVALSQVGKDAREFDNDNLLLNGPPYPIRSGETVFELSYIAQLAPWWTLQPDIQYIMRPGGNVPHPDDATRTVGNAWVFGGRTTISF